VAKKPDPAAINTLVTNALVTLATADGKRRLVTAKGGEHPPLFGSNSGANKDAIARCKSEDRPLVRIVGKGKTESVELTAAGFELILPQLPEEKVGAVARPLAESLPLTERIAFLNEIVRRTPLASAELLSVLEAAIAAEKAATDEQAAAAAKRRKQEEEALAAMERWKELAGERKKQRVEALKRELAAEGLDISGVPPIPVDQPSAQPLRPGTPEEAKFHRQVARRLVSSWLEAIRLGKPDGRRSIEVAIGNLDELEAIEQEGQTVSFDGKYHRAEVGVSTGTRVIVIRPGWRLIEDDGEYIIEQALVKP
jgi:hypothetical protein